MKEPCPILLSGDPSVKNFGWAVCNLADGGRDIYNLDRWKSGVIHPQGKEIQHKVEDAYRQLIAELEPGSQPTHAVSEQPCWMPSTKGQIAAQLDYTIRLGQMAMGVIAWFRIPAANVTLWTPQQWKGNLPKKITLARMKECFPDADFSKSSDDEVDAIALGVVWLKKWLERRFGPPLDERHTRTRTDLIALVNAARGQCNGDEQAWRGRISTILRRRGDIPRGLAREVLRQEFKIARRQIETIMNNA
jgi:hypothetical protein